MGEGIRWQWFRYQRASASEDYDPRRNGMGTPARAASQAPRICRPDFGFSSAEEYPTRAHAQALQRAGSPAFSRGNRGRASSCRCGSQPAAPSLVWSAAQLQPLSGATSSRDASSAAPTCRGSTSPRTTATSRGRTAASAWPWHPTTCQISYRKAAATPATSCPQSRLRGRLDLSVGSVPSRRPTWRPTPTAPLTHPLHHPRTHPPHHPILAYHSFPHPSSPNAQSTQPHPPTHPPERRSSLLACLAINARWR